MKVNSGLCDFKKTILPAHFLYTLIYYRSNSTVCNNFGFGCECLEEGTNLINFILSAQESILYRIHLQTCTLGDNLVGKCLAYRYIEKNE